jgi:membrane-bound serine protease (ClpP class)
VDVIASDRADLFRQLQSLPIEKNGATLRAPLSTAVVEEYPMGALRRFLHAVANPNLAYLLLIIGIYAVIYEFASPTFGIGAVAGLSCLTLAAYALSLLPVSSAALSLLILGIALLALELKFTSHGVLTTGGLVLFVLGSVFLFNTPEPYFRVSWGIIAGTVGGSAGFFVLALAKALEARRRQPATGLGTLVGQVGEVRQALEPQGMVFVNGELWSAEASTALPKETRVKVIAVQGRILKVRKLEGE